MVTLDYLRGLPEPSFGVGFDRSAITNNAVAAIQGVVAGWEYTGRGRLARALDAIIETIWTYGEINQAQAIRTLGAFAVGNDLTHLAADDGIMRRTGEGDEDLRRRWTESSVLLSVGTKCPQRGQRLHGAGGGGGRPGQGANEPAGRGPLRPEGRPGHAERCRMG